MKVTTKIAIAASTGGGHVHWLREQVRRAVPLLPRNALKEVSIALAGDAAMSRLHRQFLHIDGPTDVLTFPLESDPRGRITHGEVVVCVPEAVRRTRRTPTPVRHEILLYTLHGILHLCGLDDRTDRQFDRMHRLEDDILRRLGVGAVFHRPAPRPGLPAKDR